jgi:hypothetical protein
VKAAWVRAEREAEVRQAAWAWRRAGAVDDGIVAAIQALYPAPWPSASLLWSFLTFFFVSLATIGLFAAIVSTSHAVTSVSFLFAAALAFAADRLRTAASSAAAAGGAAAGFWSVVCLLIGVADLSSWQASTATRCLLIGALAWALASWRWGYPAFAVFSSAFFFLSLARFPQGRVLWLVFGTALAAVFVPLLDRAALAPSHRRSAAAVLAVALVAIYVAVNSYSLDRAAVESIVNWDPPAAHPSAAAKVLAALATAVFPALQLAWGIRTRRTVLLDLGIAFAALSLATLRYYVHIAPLWVILAAAGAGLIVLALCLHRWLSRSPGRERHGFTADPLFEHEGAQQALGAIGALALAPGARTPAPAEPGSFQGGGGTSGGAGSSGSWE